MESSEMEFEKLKYFVESFVAAYENRMNEYIKKIEDYMLGPGTSIYYIARELDFVISPQLFHKKAAFYEMLFNIVTKIIRESDILIDQIGCKKLLDQLYFFKNEPNKTREILVESAFKIFLSFECQFLQVDADGSWERALSKLAADAVSRTTNYYKTNPSAQVSVDSIINGVISGQSATLKSHFHAGHTVEYRTLDWNTAQLFSQVGLTDGRKYYVKKNRSSDTNTFGYRRLLQQDNLNEYCEGNPNPEFMYKYSFVYTDEHIQQLLDTIQRDLKLLKLEMQDRSKNIIFETDILDVIEYLELCIKRNLAAITRYIINNEELIEYFKDSLMKKPQVRIFEPMDSKEPEVVGKTSKMKSQFDRSRETRKQKLLEINEKLKRNIIVVICGFGGVGKSDLVRQYIDEYFDKNLPIINIDASTETTCQQGFKAAHQKLGLKIDEDGEMNYLDLIIEELYESVGEKALFIFTNAENYSAVEPFLALTVDCKPFILITSPNVSKSEWTSRRLKIETVPLDTLTDDEAIEFVKDSLKVEDNIDENIKELVHKLNNFPLALKQAVAYIKDTNPDFRESNIKKYISNYLSEYDESSKELINSEVCSNVKTTLDVIVDKIKADVYGEQATDMLNMISYFMPENIPESTFLNALAKGDEDTMLDITNFLTKYSILHLKDGMLSIHSLIQEVIRQELRVQNKELEYLKRVLDLLQKKLDDQEDLEIFAPHMTSAWSYSFKYSDLIKTYIIDDHNDSYTTYLHVIAERGNYETLEAIINEIKGTYPERLPNLIDKKNKDGRNVLQSACLSGNVEIEKLLTQCQFDESEKSFWFNIPNRLPVFIGRKEQLKYIDEQLTQKNVVVCGLAGTGKTELAFEYIHTYFDKKKFAIRIEAYMKSSAQQSFTNVHRKLGFNSKDDDGEIKSIKLIVEEVYRRIGSEGIFIFDDAEDYETIEQFLPLTESCKPSILITSRNVWSSEKLQMARLQLGGFTNEEAREFIKDSLQIKDNVEDEYVEELADKLHNCPLALNQAVAYIKSRNYEFKANGRNMGLSEYLHQYEENTKSLLNVQIDNDAKTVFKTLKITIDKIEDNSEYGQQALDILNIISYFMPNDIPANILKEIAENNEDKISNIINLLEKYAILQPSNDMFNINGLVQVVIRLELKEQKKEFDCLKKALELLRTKLNDPKDIEIYSPHIISVWKYCLEYKDLIKTLITDDYKDYYTTYFHVLVERSNFETVKAILKEIKDVYPDQLEKVINKKDKDRRILLHNAALSGNDSIIKYLIENGAHVNARGKNSWTPLHYAAQYGSLNTIKILLDYGADINSRTGYKYTVLHLAARNGMKDIVEFLTHTDADVNAQANHYETPLHFAVKMNQIDCVEALLKTEAVDVNAETQYKLTPLHFATKQGNLDIVKMLLKKRTDVNVRNLDSFTPLHFASFYNYLEVVMELLAIDNIDLNVQTSHGNTPLHLASEQGNLAVVEALIKYHAKLDIANKDGKIAEDLATDQSTRNIFSVARG